MQDVRRFLSFALSVALVCSQVSSAEPGPVQLPTSELLDAHLTAVSTEITSLESAYAEQTELFAKALKDWEISKQEYEEQVETLSAKYAISRNVTLVVTIAALATILVCSTQVNKN